MKGEIRGVIKNFIEKGSIYSAAVYIRNLNDASWMSINGDQEYLPGSLMKVPIMIYYLKLEEEHPGYLNKEFHYVKPKESFPVQAYRGDSIESGRNYKISELLRYMIEESDNNATFLLSKNIQAEPFHKIFTDLDIPPDELNDIKYVISTRDYAKFFRVLFNSTYLDEKLSQYALDLLAHCKFTDGIARKLPQGTIIARKFGERGIDNTMDFSESGIIYKERNPYLLVVMTKGTNHKAQTDLISEISDRVFHKMKDS
jgi:beta-lactamase class A